MDSSPHRFTFVLRIAASAGLVVSLSLAGCASTRPLAYQDLSSASELKPVKGYNQFQYMNPNDPLKNYDALVVDPVLPHLVALLGQLRRGGDVDDQRHATLLRHLGDGDGLARIEGANQDMRAGIQGLLGLGARDVRLGFGVVVHHLQPHRHLHVAEDEVVPALPQPGEPRVRIGAERGIEGVAATPGIVGSVAVACVVTMRSSPERVASGVIEKRVSALDR